MRRRIICALVFAASCSAGCGYHVAGHNSSLPKTIHVIAVPALENKTTSYRLEQKLTAATVHEFLAKTSYRVVSNPEDGDAVLTRQDLELGVRAAFVQYGDGRRNDNARDGQV